MKKILIGIIIAICLIAAAVFVLQTHTGDPEDIDDLLTVSLSDDWEANELRVSETNINVQEDFISNEGGGFFTVATFSYNGRSVWSKPYSKESLDEHLAVLDDMRQVEINGDTYYIGTSDSDDMPDMVIAAYVEKGDYVFEFRLSNFDDQVTDEQKEAFLKILEGVKYREDL